MEAQGSQRPVGGTGGVAVVVLAGGSSRRWGGVDKTAAVLGGLPVLAHVVAGVTAHLTAQVAESVGPAEVVVVAPDEHPAREVLAGTGLPVRWTREDPPGGGPVAGLAAALTALDEPDPSRPGHPGRPGRPGVATVVVLAGDMPFAGSAVPRLLAALAATPATAATDGVVGVDAAGVRQPLLAAYRREALHDAVSGPGAGTSRDRSLRDVLRGMVLVEVAVTPRESLDLDTPERFAVAQTELTEPHEPPPAATLPRSPDVPT